VGGELVGEALLLVLLLERLAEDLGADGGGGLLLGLVPLGGARAAALPLGGFSEDLRFFPAMASASGGGWVGDGCELRGKTLGRYSLVRTSFDGVSSWVLSRPIPKH
jgi:hypothetical protein